MLSELGHAQAARRLADAETVELLVWYVHLVYTHHCMTYDISYLSIYPSIYLSIYIHPSIHPSESFFDTLWYSFTVDASLYNQPSALHDEVSSAQPFLIFQGI